MKGHKSGFVNACILSSRSAGDDLAYVGDIDELVEHKFGNTTSIGQAVAKQLSERKMPLSQLCCINLGAVGGFYHPDKTGYANPSRIKDKLAAIGNITDSVAAYGKSIVNVKRVLRAGMHSPAFCEVPWAPDLADKNRTRLSIIHHVFELNNFRPDVGTMRVLHLTDSYSKRSKLWEINNAREGNGESFYVRDFSDMVYSALDQRSNKTEQ